MTRTEYSDKLLNSKSVSESMLVAISYISSLEAKIAELEAPKSCDGCKYIGCHDECFGCTRAGHNNDYYEPKDS